MIHYKNFIQVLEKQGATVQFCNEDQCVANDEMVGYRVDSNSRSILRYSLKSLSQKIYVFVESAGVCNFYFSDLVEFVFEKNYTIELSVVLLQDAQFNMNFSCVSSLSVDISINVYLEGDRSTMDVQGLYALDENQKVSIQTYQYHAGVDTVSNLVIKGMLTGKAQASYQGLIKIDEFAKRSDASQENKNIVLSADARVVSVPSIEVLQHDVQCCHGSAIGKFDKADMWYLQSKGIIDSQAQALLVRSFFQDVLAGSENRDEIMDVLCQKMK